MFDLKPTYEGLKMARVDMDRTCGIYLEPPMRSNQQKLRNKYSYLVLRLVRTSFANASPYSQTALISTNMGRNFIWPRRPRTIALLGDPVSLRPSFNVPCWT